MSRRVKVEVRLDKSTLNSLLMDVTQASAGRAAVRVRDRARGFAPVRTGKLRNSIRFETIERNSDLTRINIQTNNTPYAIYQEEGIGPVVAPPGGILRFQPKGMTSFIFRPRTRGFKGTHFMKRAYQTLSLSDFLP
jgi:hypothetical protein